MPGGGLFSLVAYGAQNVLLSGNPDFTYFYKSYKKYSHFAEESVTFAMDGPQDLSYDQPIQVRFKIQRIADLVRDIYFVFNLPDIYCKYIEDLEAANRSNQYNFSWTKFIGCNIIQNIGIFIGGQKIQEFNGDYMINKAHTDLLGTEYAKWERLVGNVPELYDPARGIYAGGSTGTGYPLVFNNNGPGASTTTPPNINRPSIEGRQIQVPLPFWFSETTFESLPLIALQYHECEIQITLKPINQLYTILDATSNGKQVAPGYKYNESPVALQPQNVYYTTVSDISDITINNFLTDIGTPKPLLNTWSLEPRIQLTYVYLTDDERTQFSSEPLQYLVRQVTSYGFEGLTVRQFVELDTHNPIERIFIVPRRSDSIQYRNQIDNYTNWVNPLKPPFIPTNIAWDAVTPLINATQATGVQVLNGQRSILRTLAILGDGNLLQEEKPIRYYTDTVPWKYAKGNPDPELVIYPFGLTSPTIQPDGSVNSSRIRVFQLDLNVYPLPPNTFYTYNFAVYVESLNWVNISAGMGGLKYAL